MCTTRVRPAFSYGTWAKNDARDMPTRGVAPSSPYVSHFDMHIYPTDQTCIGQLPGVELDQIGIQLSLHDKLMTVF